MNSVKFGIALGLIIAGSLILPVFAIHSLISPPVVNAGAQVISEQSGAFKSELLAAKEVVIVDHTGHPKRFQIITVDWPWLKVKPIIPVGNDFWLNADSYPATWHL